MTSLDIGATPSVPNLQDPTAGHTEILPEQRAGPDGRTLEDHRPAQKPPVEVPVTEPEGQPSEKPEETSAATNDAPVNEEERTNVNEPGEPSKGVAKVTEFKLQNMNKDPGGTTEVKDPQGDRVVDIVKQSKLKETPRFQGSDMGDFPDFPHSRPLTETSLRDGTRLSYDPSERDRKEVRSEMGRESKTPFSVTVGQKPLHVAQTRSHSDYYSKSPSTSRFTYIPASLNQFDGFHHETGSEIYFRSQNQRSRRPPKLVRLATVTMSPKVGERRRTKPLPRGPSLYYEEPKKPQKVITWDEANEARPPLRIDMEGPGPTMYSPRNKPLNETNAPAWTFGSKCFVEKSGGSRTSWEKTWFQSPNVWTNKVDFYNDSAWPAPTQYKQRQVLGPRQRTMFEPPSFTIGVRKEMTMAKRGSSKEPSPVDYDRDTADKITMKQGPSFSHQFRREGTVIWPAKEKGPGPGSYSPKYSYNQPHGPAFSIRCLRREKSHVLGPFSTI